jgi:ribosomal protein S18 acetylase RimI-like enzyme
MPHPIRDKSGIRRRLNADRDWSLYPLADLDDGMFEHCDWWAEGDALALVFRALAIRPIFVLGDAAATRALLAAIPEPRGYLNLKPDQVEAAAGLYRYRERHEMLRMILDEPRPAEGRTEPLGPGDRERLERLFATGDGGGIAFAPYQLETGFFRGIADRGELAAAGGVHVVSRNEGIAGAGNIFTRPDCRGRGLAKIVTWAVVAALREAGIRTIGLNVESTNIPAIRAYEAIGFRTRFHYYEGTAEKIV